MKLIKTQLLFTKDPMELYIGGGVTTISLPVFVTVIHSNFVLSKDAPQRGEGRACRFPNFTVQ
nr:unnamed protein product [Callosobruchus analis]